MKNKKLVTFVFTGVYLLILILILVVGIAVIKVNSYRNKIKKQNETIEEQGALIMSYADYYLEHKCQCDCGWYEDFYYEHAEEQGAYE